jgi:hypothetical protein
VASRDKGEFWLSSDAVIATYNGRYSTAGS